MRESCFLLGNARRDCLPLNERAAKEKAEDLLLKMSGTEETQKSLGEKKSGLLLLRSKIPGWLTVPAGMLRACAIQLGNKCACPTRKCGSN